MLLFTPKNNLLINYVFTYILNKGIAMKKSLLIIATTSLILTACSNEYAPTADASGEDIYKAACMECHKPVEGKDNIYYELTADKKNLAYIEAKISEGSLMMPKFPNLTGNSLKAVSQYALEHSIEKK